MTWKTIERPGYFGKKRDELTNKWNKKFGKDNWKIAYEWNFQIIQRPDAIQIYEDGYYEFFKNNPKTLDWLINTASEVYDTAVTNIQAGFNYKNQETPNNHIHDVAIRRSIMRLGEKFQGDHLVHVRWKDSEGFRVNPGVVKFHKPGLIIPGKIKDYGGKGIWWNEKTIEDFYQRNKVLQIRK